jgi:uncharacterized protein YciI
MFIVILTYKKPLTEVDKFGNDHLAFLSKFFEAGKFVVSGRRNPRTGGVIIAHNVTREQLDDIVKEDPFYKNGLADYDITEFTPVKYQEAFKVFVTD